MDKTIFLNAGHSLSDPGAVKYVKEAEISMRVRDLLVPELERQGFRVFQVPDNLNLNQSIKWVNSLAKTLESGLALALHCNAGGGTGAEAFYYAGSNKSKLLAEKLLAGYLSVIPNLKNRGVKPDTNAVAKRLGWIRDTRPWALLLEMGFVDNPHDAEILKNYKLLATAVCKGVCNVYGLDYKPAQNTSNPAPKSPTINETKEKVSKPTSAPKPASNYSIVDFLISVGQPSDFAYRSKLYAQSGLASEYGAYKGTAEQNLALLEYARKKFTPQPAPQPAPQGLNTETSIVDFLKSRNMPSSFAERAKLYQKIFGETYYGNEKQNTKFLEYAKKHF